MISLIQKISAISDHQGVTSTEEDFDRLVEKVEADEMELILLESQIHDEFEVIEGDIKKMSTEVDRAVR